MTAPTGHRSAGPGSQSAPGALRVLLDLVSGLVGLTSQVVVSPPRPRLTPLLELPGPFREIVEFAPDAIIVHVQGRYVYVNQAAVRLFGARDAADLIGTSLVDRVHPDDREFARDRIRQSQSGGELAPVTDLRVLRMDGSVVDVEVRASRFHWDDRPAVQAVIREISDRKRGEQLQAAVYRIAQAADQAVTLEDLYREIHTIVSGVMPADNFFIAYYDRQRDILSFPYFVDQVDMAPGPRPAGHTLTEYVLRTGKSLLCTEEVDAALQASGEVELVGEPSAIWLGVPLLSCDKTIGAMVVQHYSDPQAYGERERQMLEFVSSQVAQAIERKSQLLARAEAETALRDSEERYRNLVENAPVGIYRTTPDGRILSANPTIVRMLGYNSFEELARFNLEREGRAAGYRRKRFAEMLEQDGVVRGLESAWRRRDGAEIFVRENAQAVRGAGGEILYYDGTVEDITERRRVEESERELRALAEALRDTAALLNSTLNQDQVMDLMLSNLGRVVPHDASSIMLVENGIGRIVRTRGYAERGADAEIRAVEFRIDDYPLLREIAQGGRPAVIPDTRAFPAWARLPHTDWIRSHASAPLRVRGETVGFVGVGSTIPGFFKEQHGARLQAFADQASIALENARLLSETERRANQFAALYETAQELAYPRDLAIRLDGIVDRARALLDAQGAFIYLYDEARDELALTIEKGMGIPSGLRLKSGEGLAGRVAETRQPQLVENYSAWENRSGAYEGRDLRAIVEVPMIHAGELLGVLGVSEMEGSTRRFGEEDLQLLTLFAGQAASALKSARLLDETGTRAQQLALLYDAGLTLNGVLEPRAQLEFLLKIALRALHADHAEFFRYEPSSRELSLELGVDAAAADPSAQAARSNAADESGPLAWVLKHRVPLNVPAFPDDPRTRTMNGGLAAGLWTPVERTGEVRGVLAVFSKRRDAFSLQDERLLVLFANQAAVALENARLYTELAESLAMTTQFYHVTGQVLQADSFQETAHLITQALREALNADFTSIALVDEEGQSTFEHGIGYPEGFFDRTADPPDEMAAQAWRTGQPVVADNPEQFPAAVRELGVRAGICLPLAGDTGRLGLLFVQYRRPHVFAERELKTLALFANQASLAMRRVRLLEQARARAAKLAVLNRIAGAASRSEDLDALLNRIYQEVRDTVSTDGFFIALCDESTNELDFRLSVDQDEHLPPARLPRERVPLTSFALDSRQTTFIPDILADSTGNRYPRMTLIGSGNDPRTWLGVPLHVGDKIIGLLSVQSYRPNAYTPEEQQLIETIADQAAIAIQNARLFDETRQRLAEMEAVNRISTGVRVAASLEEMLPGLLAETLAAVDASDGMLAFYDAPARQLAIGAARGWFSALPTGLSTEEGVLGRVFTEGAIDLGREPGAESFAAGLSTPPGCTRVVIPILAGQDRVGVLAVLLAHPRDVTLSQVRLLETIAEIAGTTVQRIRLSGKIEDAFLDTALALARIVDERDSETSGHSDRLAEIALWLASALDLSPQEQEDLRLAARLHDIGKSGVPDAILLKPDSLGPAEWSILKKHPAIGAEIIQPLQRLRGVAPLVLHHQERYDGTGYPEGLAGEGIPLGARILALADAVSAMVDGRIYRKARSWAEVRAELERCAGNQFDPRLVDLLLQHWPGLQVGPPG